MNRDTRRQFRKRYFLSRFTIDIPGMREYTKKSVENQLNLVFFSRFSWFLTEIAYICIKQNTD